MSDNVQLCDVSVYSRVKEARDCRVCSTILLPIFADSKRLRVAAVLELVQFRQTTASFQKIFEWSRHFFEVSSRAKNQCMLRHMSNSHLAQSHLSSSIAV